MAIASVEDVEERAAPFQNETWNPSIVSCVWLHTYSRLRECIARICKPMEVRSTQFLSLLLWYASRWTVLNPRRRNLGTCIC